MKLPLEDTVYKRVDNILYANDLPIIKFTHSKFPDFDPLSQQGVKYMQSYIDMWPQHYEICEGWIVADDPTPQEVVINVGGVALDSLEGTVTLTRKQQVEFYLNQGITSPKQIAQEIGTNPSYVQRLIKEITNG